MQSLIIGFLLGSPHINGGTYVIYEHATRLRRIGHRVVLITQQEVEAKDHAWHSSAHELEWLTVEQAKEKQFDIVLATWWQSPFLLYKFQATHYIYFVQSIETRFFQPPDLKNYVSRDDGIWQDLCEKTYSYALPVITEAEWIRDYIYEKYNNYPWLVRNGIRKDIYTIDGDAFAPCVPGKLRVLVEGPVDVEYKNVPKSIELAKRAGADEIWLLTSSDIEQHEGVDRVFSQVPIHDTPSIYRSCDILLKLSYVEGMFGPPLEIFHCGGTALVYDVTGHDEYIVHDSNSYVVEKDKEDEVIRLLRLLKEQPDELKRLKAGARQTALEWPGWDRCSKKFEHALLEISRGKPTSRSYLQRYTKELFDVATPLVKAAKVLDTFISREKSVWEGKPTAKENFIEFYWDPEGEFNQGNSQWKYYQNEEWATLKFKVEVTAAPFWLRLDPSIHIGIINIEFLVVKNTTRQTEIMAFRDPQDFQVLLLTGDLKWIIDDRKNVMFSYGDDPVFVLPPIENSDASIGDYLEISIRLKETGIQQFFNEWQVDLVRQEPMNRTNKQIYNWLRSIFQKK